MRIFNADKHRSGTTPVGAPGMYGVEHKGNVVYFNNGKTGTRTLNIPSSTNSEDVLRYINVVFENLTAEQQTLIFDAYRRIREIMDTVIDVSMVARNLTSVVTDLYSHLKYDDVVDIVKRKIHIHVPPKVVERYEDMEISERSQENRNYLVTTYLRSDYVKLVTMAIFIKPMIPIWSEYIRMSEASTSKSTYRESIAMNLISKTEIMKLEPFDRLRDYIRANMNTVMTQGGRRPNTTTAVLGGLGTSELPDWLLAKTIVRKLIFIELSTADDNSSVISIIYKNVESEMASLSRKFKGEVRPRKKPHGDRDDSEDKSVLEIYKMQQEHSDGDILVTPIYMEKSIEEIASKFEQLMGVELDRTTLMDFYIITSENRKHILTDAQMTILGWIVHPLIHIRGLDYINLDAFAKLKAIAQTYLWVEGFKEMALLLTALEVRDDTGGFLGGLDSKNLISKQNVATLMELFPHYQDRRSRESERQRNVACITINAICDEISRCDWNIVMSPEYINSINSKLIDDYGTMVPPSTIRDQLAEIIIGLNTPK